MTWFILVYFLGGIGVAVLYLYIQYLKGVDL